MKAINKWSPLIVILLVIAAMIYRYFYPLAE